MRSEIRGIAGDKVKPRRLRGRKITQIGTDKANGRRKAVFLRRAVGKEDSLRLDLHAGDLCRYAVTQPEKGEDAAACPEVADSLFPRIGAGKAGKQHRIGAKAVRVGSGGKNAAPERQPSHIHRVHLI